MKRLVLGLMTIVFIIFNAGCEKKQQEIMQDKFLSSVDTKPSSNVTEKYMFNECVLIKEFIINPKYSGGMQGYDAILLNDIDISSIEKSSKDNEIFIYSVDKKKSFMTEITKSYISSDVGKSAHDSKTINFKSTIAMDTGIKALIGLIQDCQEKKKEKVGSGDNQ
jgi:hypothetical protein